MGIFDVFRKKSISFQPDNYFLDILGSSPIKITGQEDIADFALKSYYKTPQLASIINYASKIASRNDLRFYNDSGKEQENEILKLFNNPHPLYSEGEFWETVFKQFFLFNICLIYKSSGIGNAVSGLFVLPFNLIKIVPVKGLTPIDILMATDIKEIISHYELSYRNKVYRLEVEDVWSISGSSLRFDKDGYLQPDNIIETLQYPIKNIQANYEARYSLVNNRGMLGLWVNQNRSDAGTIPLEDHEKKEIFAELRRTYGLTGGRELNGITNANLKFESANLPIKDMELSEGILQDKIALCDAFNFPLLLLNELEGSTYSNLDNADRNLYTKNTLPLWELFEKSITREFIDSGYVEFYTGDIEALKKDDKIQAETSEINTRLVINLNNAQSMDYESKVNTLMLLADVSEEVARLVITEQPLITENNQGNELL
jgi:phage portal protein BeeE